jgi:hypothetical protein
MNDAPTPYVGLVPYTEDDAAFFFGRTEEKQIVTGNLRASRLTVLCGPSGVGKTSLLHAGVVHDLREQVRANAEAPSERPPFAVCAFSDWRSDPRELVEALGAAVGEAVDEKLPPANGTSLEEAVRGWGDRVRTLLVVLDQFEDYFLYHSDGLGDGTFASEFPRLVNDPGLRVNFLLSLREDALADLDRFHGQIPNLFGNLLRLDRLDYRCAHEAIVEPVTQYNRLVGDSGSISIEDGLAEAVLEQVASGRVVLGERGEGTAPADAPDPAQQRFETTYLQLVMLHIWSTERSSGSQVLRRATFDRLGGAERIIRTHLDGAMSELSRKDQDVAARAFRYLVTPSNTKVAYTAGDLAEYAEVPKEKLAPVLGRLAGGKARILRTVPTRGDEPAYEIFHDALAPGVLDWRSRFMRRRHERRLKTGAAAAALVALAVLAGVIWSLASGSSDSRLEKRLRGRIVAASLWGVGHGAQIHYSQAGIQRLSWLERKPYALPLYVDSSSFVTWCYWVAGAPNPNGTAYNLRNPAYTGTLLQHMKQISESDVAPGDVVVWTPPASGYSTAVVVEGGKDPLLVSQGSERGPIRVRFSKADASFRARGHDNPIWLTIF